MTDQDEIEHVPPPWKLKGTVYCFMYWIPASQAKDFPIDIAYSPLERSSSFAVGSASGKPKGGLASVMVLRYRESPVGAYDEIIFATGKHSYVVERDGKRVEKQSRRMTRLYVSQKVTCWNGRRARFEFHDLAEGGTEIKVFPHDIGGDPSESAPSDSPFFRAVYKPLRFVPHLPLTTSIAKFVGIDMAVVQPPVPEGRGSQGELAGSDRGRWCGFTPMISSRATGFGCAGYLVEW
ncbi:uncharacterized protein DNG_01679 [Cephalotrichum gorgonifer]|uniref:Uncharacterized protein n=1 Tax=Cephalotrichum gorgonifer TaxID=2041049 RepID=A0AAE8MT27_9PEZI|nr:uncharacterized protein DNG_01679 [Cephalotrichum gorgonifer]